MNCAGFAAAAAEVGASEAPPAAASKVPANARVWTITTVRGHVGTEAMWTDASGVRRSSRAPAGDAAPDAQPLDHAISVDRRGVPVHVVVSGSEREEFHVTGTTATWRYPSVSRQAPWHGGFYVPGSAAASFGRGAIQPLVVLLDALMAQPGHELSTLPSGKASLERLTTATVSHDGATRRLTAWMINGLSFIPYIMWLDEQGEFFARLTAPAPSEPESWILQGWEDVTEALRAEQLRAITAHSKQRAAELLAPAGAVVFENVRVYDSASNGFRENLTVSVEAGKIIAVGPPGSVAIPRGAKRLGGRGKTLLPGLWDMHAHLWRENSGLAELSVGVTSVREMSNYEGLLRHQVARIEAGELLGPRVFSNRALYSGTEDPLSRSRYVGSLEQGLALIRASKDEGFHGLKMYAGLKPEWIAPFAAEAHRLGLKIVGHVPAEVNILDAVRAGYDDVSHLRHFFNPGLPQAVLDLSPDDPRRWPRVVRATLQFDLERGPMAELLDAMVEAQTATDPTLALYEDWIVAQPGELAPGYQPYAGLLAAQEMQAATRSAYELAEDLGMTRREYQESFQGFIALTRGMHERGIRIFPGTDSTTTLFVRELELFVQAGFTIGEALEAATDGAARFMGVGERVGSIAPGMEADLILVDADVSKDIGALRQLEWVMTRGRLIKADELRAAVGMLGRPRRK